MFAYTNMVLYTVYRAFSRHHNDHFQFVSIGHVIWCTLYNLLTLVILKIGTGLSEEVNIVASVDLTIIYI